MPLNLPPREMISSLSNTKRMFAAHTYEKAIFNQTVTPEELAEIVAFAEARGQNEAGLFVAKITPQQVASLPPTFARDLVSAGGFAGETLANSVQARAGAPVARRTPGRPSY